MLNVVAHKTGLLVVCLSLLLAACAGPKTQDDARTSVDAADAVLNRFLRDPEMGSLQRNLPQAKALMICPNILQAGFIVGGAGGRCVVLARSASSPTGWHGPAFYHIATGSVGLQAGAQASEMVALVNTEKGLNSLLSNSFKLGADVSIAAGPVGAGTGAPLTADMVSYVRSKGLYGGLNFDGSVITVDETANQAYYGRPGTPVEILIKGSLSNPQATTLMRTASSGAAGQR